MKRPAWNSGCPERLVEEDDRRRVEWYLCTDRYAVKQAGDGEYMVAAAPVPPEVEQPLPVYRQASVDVYSVASGLVYLVLAEGQQAEQHRAAIQAAGYRILNIPRYAPHTAWLEATSTQVADALNGLDRLQALPQVHKASPQLLLPRVYRDAQ